MNPATRLGPVTTRSTTLTNERSRSGSRAQLTALYNEANTRRNRERNKDTATLGKNTGSNKNQKLHPRNKSHFLRDFHNPKIPPKRPPNVQHQNHSLTDRTRKIHLHPNLLQMLQI
ncbi:hypothetical protein FHG87_023222 [Trinorchestia longiramus]|nr:hypothetical protein FHG87_023222 [Trinorchestia longiramus]